jgi:pimeloyl-ACP methyl ester carboxylesterase
VPLTTIHIPNTNSRPETLLILLPGRGGSAKDFLKAKFPETARQAGYGFDMIAVNLYESYYYNRTMMARLKQDILDPARSRGYKHVWLVGTSLGGFGSFMYSKSYPGEVDGIIALAPYLGDQELMEEIESQGGPRNWKPQRSKVGKDYELELWEWLRDGHGEVPVFLAYGTDDHMALGHQLLAKLLPARATDTIQGGHHWNAWSRLWSDILTKNVLPRS